MNRKLKKKITQKNRWVPWCSDLNITCPPLVVFGKVMEPLGDGVSLQEAVSREGGRVTHSPPQCIGHLGLTPPAFPSVLLLTKYSITTTGKELENTDSVILLMPHALRRQDYGVT